MPHLRWLCLGLLLSSCSTQCGVPRTETAPAKPPRALTIFTEAGPLTVSKASMALMRDVPRLEPANQRSPLGTNLATPNYFSRDWPFLNAFRAALPFVSFGTEWDDKRPLNLDEHGIPTRLLDDQNAVTIVPTFSGGHLVLTYEGDGHVSLESSDGSHKVLSTRPGRIEFTVNRDQEVNVWIHKTNPKNHVRNFRLVPTGLEARQGVFRPDFLERLRPFRVLRFMDWANTNHQKLQHWKDRTRPDWFTQAVPTGMAYEYMVRLGNALQADIWLCIPHRADDELVWNLAQLVAAGLDKNLKVYVEYSNEIWNGIFDQAHYAMGKGKQLGLDRDEFKAGARFQSERSVEIMKIFERAFSKRPHTLVRVMGSQVGNKWHHADLLEWKDAMEHIDAIAVAPYFGHSWGTADNAEMMKKTKTDDLIRKVESRSMKDTFKAIRLSTAYAKSVNKRLIAYEGGQHIIATPDVHNDEALDRKIDALQRHPYMAKLYGDLLTTWKDNGGQLFVHYTFIEMNTKWSKFGALERQDQPRSEAPKLDALLTFIAQNPSWWTAEQPTP